MAKKTSRQNKPKRARSPQEKKRLSYSKDRRNTFGEPPHAARKSVPKRRSTRSRGIRHAVRQAIDSHDDAESRLDRTMGKNHTRWRWKKSPDSPLGEVVRRKRERRRATGQGG